MNKGINTIMVLRDNFTRLVTPWGDPFRTSCLVRTVKSPAPFTRGMDEVVYTEPDDKSQPVPYMPQTFPIGTWDVYAPMDKEPDGRPLSPYEAPWFVGTSAWRETAQWDVTQHDSAMYAGPTSHLVRDSGFGFHTSTSPTTLGCCRVGTPLVPGEPDSIRQEKLQEGIAEIERLVKYIQEALGYNDTIQVEVIP